MPVGSIIPTRYGIAPLPRIQPSTPIHLFPDSHLGVFAIDTKGGSGMTLIELADGVSVEEIKAKTEANFQVAVGQQAAA